MQYATQPQINTLQSQLLKELAKVQSQNNQLETKFKELTEGINVFRIDIENRFKKEVQKLEKQVENALKVNETTLGKVSYVEASFAEIENGFEDQISTIEKLMEPFNQKLESAERTKKTLMRRFGK